MTAANPPPDSMPSKPVSARKGEGRGAAAERAFHEEASLGAAYDTALLRKIWPFLRPYWLSFTVSLLLLPLLAELLVAQPRTMQRAIDLGIVARDTSALNQASLVMLGLVIAEFIARFVQLYLMQFVGQQVMADLRRHTFAFLHRQRLAFFDRQPVGRLVTRVTNDVDALGELFASGAVTAVGDLFTLVRIFVAMMLLSPKLSLFAFVAVPPLGFLVDRFRRNAREAFREIRSKTARMNAYLNEQVHGIAVVQAYGQEARCEAEFDEINGAYRRANILSIKYDALLFAVVEMFSSVCVASLLFVGARAVGLGTPAASIGALVAFVQYIQRFFEPMRDLSGKYTILQSSMAGAERIFQLLDAPEPDATGEATRVGPVVADAPRIAFEHVSFGYGPDKPVLRDVSFDVQRGQTIALVGATGAGKTTVVALLQRLYEIDAGVIRVDGQDIRGLGREALRSRFAVVPQDAYLFPGDVLSNVAVGDDAPDEALAAKCATDVGLDRLLTRRGAGLKTRVDERGQNFSAGERQLIALARALYRRPEILLLDEATSSIDSESEAVVQEAIKTALRERTALVIAHRLSTIRNADQILVFHKGQVAERGTHDELVAAGGIYARLHRLQFEHAESSAAA